jgi:hypothetical protein
VSDDGWWHDDEGQEAERPNSAEHPPTGSAGAPPSTAATTPAAGTDDGWWGDAQSDEGAHDPDPTSAGVFESGAQEPTPPVVFSPVDPSDADGAQPVEPDYGAAATEAVPTTPNAYPTLGPASDGPPPTAQNEALRPSLGPPTDAHPTLGPPETPPIQPPGSAGVDAPPNAPLGRRMSVVARFAASLLFLIGTATLLGWSIKRSLTADPTAVRLAQEVAESAGPAGVAPRTSLAPQDDVVDLPDVRGSKRDEALAVLTEAGLAGDVVKVKEVAWVAPAGQVVEQSPAPGTDNPESVELSISKKATAPKLAGAKEDAAVTSLEALGATAEISREYRVGTEPGIVLAQEPAEGAELTESVKVTISEAGVPVSLDKLETAGSSSGCGSGTVTVNSIDREAAMTCTVAPGGEADTNEYVLAGQHGQFRATLVVSSDSQLGQQARVTVRTEAGEIAGQSVGVGSEVPIQGDVTGAQRLYISIAPASADSGLSSDGVQVGLVDAQVLTSPDVAEQLNGD